MTLVAVGVLFGLSLACFLIYCPVLFAWADRREVILDSIYERYQYGSNRRAYVTENWFLSAFPWMYSRLLILHAGWHGWIPESAQPFGGMYMFVPDNPVMRERYRLR